MSHLGVNDFIDHSTKHPTTPSSSSSSPLPTPSLPKPSKLGSQQVSDSFEVYQAKFKYDPTKYSPNDNPDLELSFEIGDYLFVYGLPDEDGFFVGESMDGKKGFVPSNFVEKVPDETLIAIKSSLVVQRILSPPSKAVESNLPSPTKNISIVHETKPTQPKQFTNQSEDCLELNVCELVDPKEPPPPKDLRVERQLANSVMIAWSPPVLHSTDSTLKSYSVYVDGHLQCLVDAMDRTKALLERIELSKVHRVCLRCNYSNHMDSADQKCTIMIGTGINYSPTDFRVSNVTSFTAEITWMPSNSNLEHIILVDGRCRAAIRPGNYRCIVTGLAADTRHSISIQPRVDPTCPGSTKMCITFKTLPSEIPDAPVEVQVEAGPRQGTLLVMWAPVRPNGKPPNSSINGYCVYVNGKKIKELHSPIGDHVLLESEDFMEVMEPKHLTVRSITHNHESIDSLPFLLSSKLLSELSFKELPVNSIHLPTPHANSTFNFKTPAFHQSRDSKLNHHEASFSAQQLSPLEKRNAQTADTNQQIITNQCIDRCRTPSKMDQTDTRDQVDTIATRDNVSDSSFEEANRTRNLPRVQNNFRRSRVMQQDNNNYARMDAMNRRSKSMRRDGQKRSRYFLALFDYDPAIMSPNPDGISEELPFKEGQIIKVHGSKDADGFYMGELSNGMRGLVPSNMINEIDEPSSRKPRQTFVGSNTLPHQSSLHKQSHRNQTCEVTGTPRQMIAMQNFDPIVHPPNRDIEPGLPFRVGELIFVHGAVDCNGYYRGEKNGVYGLVPADFLRDAGPNEQQFSQQIQISNQIKSRHESYSSALMCNNQSANQREGLNHLTNQHSVQSFDPRSESFMSPQSQVLPNVTSSYKQNPSVQPTFAQQFSGPHPQHSHPHQLQQHSNQPSQQQHPNQPSHQQQQHPNQPPQQQQQHSNQLLLHQQQQHSNQQIQQFSQHPQQHFQQQAQHLAMLPQHSQQQQLPMYLQQHQLYPQQTVVPQRLQHFPQQQMEHFQSLRDPPPGIRYQQQPQHQQQQMESKLVGIDNFHQRGRQEFEQRQMLPQQQNFQHHQPSFNQ